MSALGQYASLWRAPERTVKDRDALDDQREVWARERRWRLAMALFRARQGGRRRRYFSSILKRR